MKKPGINKYWLLTLLLFIGTVVLYFFMGIIPSEGFNPSDDGVILAQSYRLLQGQIPHYDFISIRPVGSAVFHSLHFISPLPLEISARWLVLIQYLAYSLLWSWIMIRFSRIRKYRGLIFFALVGLWGFLLNQNHYNLYPWTTIDALFWIILALSFFLPNTSMLFQKRGWIRVALVTFFACMAFLSRQTFALPALILVLSLIILGIRKKKYLQLIIGLIIGGIPLFAYLSILVFNNSLPEFIQQLSGRTELFETGVKSFFIEFWDSPLVWFYVIVIFLLLLYRLTEGSGTGNVYRLSLVPIARFVFAALFTILAFTVFLSPGTLFGQSFLQFWLLVLLWAFEEVTKQIKTYQRKWFFWIVLLSWTSAISLGDNAPVFAIGLINVTALTYILFQFVERGLSFYRLNHLHITSVILLVALSIISLRTQRKENYRDVSARDQKYELKNLFPEFGGIKTNENTYSYFEEVDRLYHELGYPQGRFVMIPNAAIIYPIIKTPNPLPVDWMQGPEFIGSEEMLKEKLSFAAAEKEIFFLIEKYNAKIMADSLVPAMYNELDYPYMDDLINLTKEYPINSKWFEVRVTK